jgi:hypothetical protein
MVNQKHTDLGIPNRFNLNSSRFSPRHHVDEARGFVPIRRVGLPDPLDLELPFPELAIHGSYRSRLIQCSGKAFRFRLAQFELVCRNPENQKP